MCRSWSRRFGARRRRSSGAARRARSSCIESATHSERCVDAVVRRAVSAFFLRRVDGAEAGRANADAMVARPGVRPASRFEPCDDCMSA